MDITKHRFSPLIHAGLLNVTDDDVNDDVTFWDKTRPPEIEARDDDTRYVVRSHERLDTLANRELGSPRLGWVILARNGLGLVPNGLVPGKIIFIPTTDSLKSRGVI